MSSDFLTTGPRIAEFEAKFASVVGAKHAVAVCNATAALHLAMLVLDVGTGDRVITSPNTFLSSANAAAFVGATPDFADIDPISYTLSPNALADTWQPDTKVVVAVDYAGQTADMPRIADIARNRNAAVIEDACHAVGGSFEHEGKIWKVGGHPWADITTFSFHPVKTMTTGEGGMLVTDNDEYAERARRLRSHGMTREPKDFRGLGMPELNEYGPWYYEMQSLGYNYRITDLQCALGISQLSRLNQFVERRREIVKRYNSAFSPLPTLTTPKLRNAADETLTSWHLYTLLIDYEKIGRSRSEIMADLRENEILTQVLYIPVYLQPWYRSQYGYQFGKCPEAERYYESCLTLPLYPAMTDINIEKIVHAMEALLIK
jgi:UDP-4-amino-4,6-dideoxy-N-acetyl-beta-L-altrosamine transaminase